MFTDAVCVGFDNEENTLAMCIKTFGKVEVEDVCMFNCGLPPRILQEMKDNPMAINMSPTVYSQVFIHA